MANKMSEKKKSVNESDAVDEKSRSKEVKSEKIAKASAREERPVKAHREVKASSEKKKSGNWRNWRLVRFAREAYQELRYKVTWPTFHEARNMTIMVILLSTAVGLVLGLVDAGLFQLFKLITGK